MHINYNFISLNSMTKTDKERGQTRSDSYNPRLKIRSELSHIRTLISYFGKKKAKFSS